MINSNYFENIHAVVLAAGKSERMGSPKMLLPFGSQTIIESVIDNILNSGIENVMVVLGAYHQAISKVICKKPVHTCFNPNFEEGMHSSVICGFSHLLENARAVLLFLGDQPFIPPEVIRLVVDAWHKSENGIVVPVVEGKRGHPVLIDLKLKNEVMQMDPLSGLRSVIALHPMETEEVEVNFPQILRDIDTKNDYITELKLIKQNGRNNQI